MVQNLNGGQRMRSAPSLSCGRPCSQLRGVRGATPTARGAVAQRSCHHADVPTAALRPLPGRTWLRPTLEAGPASQSEAHVPPQWLERVPLCGPVSPAARTAGLRTGPSGSPCGSGLWPPRGQTAGLRPGQEKQAKARGVCPSLAGA